MPRPKTDSKIRGHTGDETDAGCRVKRAAMGVIEMGMSALAMPKITYIDFSGTARTVEGAVGATVMETAIKNDVPGINAECGGACSCSTCHVYVDAAWEKAAGTPGPIEEDMLDFALDLRPNSRLSCQIEVTEALDGLVVNTPQRQA